MKPVNLYAVEQGIGATIIDRLPVQVVEPGAAHDFRALPPIVGLSAGYAVCVLSNSGNGLMFVAKDERLSSLPPARMTIREAHRLATRINSDDSNLDEDILVTNPNVVTSMVYEVTTVLRRVGTVEIDDVLERELVNEAKDALTDEQLAALLKHYGVKSIEG